MTDTSELVKRLNECGQEWTDDSQLNGGPDSGIAYEAAQAIERLERELEITKASLTDAEKAEHKLADCKSALLGARERIERIRAGYGKLESELAEARARDEDRQEAIRAVLKVLPTQREPHPDDNLQKLVNLACSLLDDAFTDYAPEALATPAPIETTGKAAVMDPTIAKKQQESD